ncbi:MAG: C10 family peptidase [bacterium]|nr:C10 family peptidase [bacterium]
MLIPRILAALSLLTAVAASASPVDAPEARAVAVAQLARLDARGHAVAWQDDVIHDGRVVARVHGLAPVGYVVVAADSDLPPVVAYSLESSYPRGDGPNPLRAILAADLACRLNAATLIDAEVAARWHAQWDNLRDGKAQPVRFEQWPPAGSTPTGGWLLTNWTQNAPYNDLCPVDLARGGARSVAGCPAVAMAMILDYHGTLQGTVFDDGDRYWHAYAGNNYWIPDAAARYGFPTFEVLNGCLQTLGAHWEAGTPLTNTDKAALVFACGTAASQVYSAAGSGTFAVAQAYAAFVRCGFTSARLVLEADPDLYADLRAQMQSARPAHLAVVDPSWSMGHNLVVDGYNADDFYHLNFGWGGPYNGWYRLPQEMPYGLTVVEGLILDIAPTVSAVANPTPGTLSIASHPNPFNPLTVIRFTAPVGGRARLTVYDLAGRRLAVLLDGDVTAGTHAVPWQARDLASGVYLARVEIGNLAATARMVLVR